VAQACAGKAGGNILQQRPFAAVQVGRAGDIQRQAIRLYRHPWAIARGPTGQHLHKTRIGLRRGLGRLQARAEHAGLPQPHALLQPLRTGGGIQAINPLGIALALAQGKGGIHRAGAQNALTREPLKPH